MVGAGGIEPPHGGIKIRCLTAWLRPNPALERPVDGPAVHSLLVFPSLSAQAFFRGLGGFEGLWDRFSAPSWGQGAHHSLPFSLWQHLKCLLSLTTPLFKTPRCRKVEREKRFIGPFLTNEGVANV